MWAIAVWVFDADHLCSGLLDHFDGHWELVGVSVAPVDGPESSLAQNFARRVQLAKLFWCNFGVFLQHTWKSNYVFIIQLYVYQLGKAMKKTANICCEKMQLRPSYARLNRLLRSKKNAISCSSSFSHLVIVVQLRCKW